MVTYLTARDLEELIRVDKSTIYRMAEDGRLPAVKVGRQWRFPEDAVMGWLGIDTGGAVMRIEHNLSDAIRWATTAAGRGTSALQRLERIAETLIEGVIESDGTRAHTPQLMLEVWAEASKDPQLGDLLARGYDHWRTFIAQLFREGIASGEIRADIDPEVLAAICVAMFDGLTLQESITKTKVNWRHVVATLRQMLIEGVIVAAKPPQEA